MKEIAIITGASSGIGREICKELCEKYAFDEVWLIARGEEKLKALADELKTPAKVIPLDLSKTESGEKLRALLEEEQPAVKVLINASGYGKFEAFDEIAESDNLGMIDLNCRALTQICYLCLPYLKAGATIVNIASVAAFQPIPYGTVYAASKAYVLSFTRALNRELKSRKIHALAVCPFWTKTAFLDRSNGQSVITRFDCMYEPKFIAQKTVKAIASKRDYLVPGFVAKCTHALTKLFPHSFVMSVFLREQNLHKR